ncbi:MAG: hypothetical protein ABI728_13525, partial [Betaproteobacteria bacterium]
MVEPAQSATLDQLGAVLTVTESAATCFPHHSHINPNHAADALHWEPDGVTLQVRFCEGGAT